MKISDEDILISIALVTRNRPASLERTLKSLRTQSVQPFEVIISDDSDEVNAVAVKALASVYDCQYIRGPQSGLYANRNHAALACRGTHIRTMDDDHEFIAEHFACCAAAVAEDSQSVWIIGEYEPDTVEPDKSPPCPGELHPRGFSVAPKDTQNCWAIADGASIYPRAVFDSGTRYTEDFKFGAAYLEFGSRLYSWGYRMRYLDQTYIIHHFVPSARSYADATMDLASRFYAMFCHSFLYQPTGRNKLLTALEVGKQIVFSPQLFRRAFYKGLTSYRQQKLTLTQCRPGTYPLMQRKPQHDACKEGIAGRRR